MINNWNNIIIDGGGSSDGVKGTPTGSYETKYMTFGSSIDDIQNINAKVVYDDGLSNMPIMLLIHGWGDTYSSFEQATYERFASYKFFVIGVGMRERNGANGTRDISGREVYDIYDHIDRAYYQFEDLVDRKRTFVTGYSNGAGLAYELGSRFPDKFGTIIVHFGISDYGRNDVSSWYITNNIGIYTNPMDMYIGSPRTSYKNEYLSREIRQSIGKNFKGKMYIYHDEDDTAVDVVHSDLLITQLISDGFTNYTYSKTTSADSPRWSHAYPNGSADVIQTEAFWKDEALTLKPIDVANTGTFLVRGYIVTKKFTIWLGDGVDSAKDGTNRSVTVVYDVNNDSYTITPIFETGATQVEVIITQADGKSATQIITSVTEIIVT